MFKKIMKKTTKFFIVLIVISSLSIKSKNIFDKSNKIFFSNKYFSHPKPNSKPKSFKDKIQDHTLWQTKQQVIYDGSYVKLDYPGGDVSPKRGVCTDVVIRALRAIDIDLQKEIHEDIKKAKSEYNKRYKTKHVDPSIDHLRMQNIETFLERKGCKVNYDKDHSELKFQKGDIVFF